MVPRSNYSSRNCDLGRLAQHWSADWMRPSHGSDDLEIHSRKLLDSEFGGVKKSNALIGYQKLGLHGAMISRQPTA
jgi:hypothetical protein